MRFITKVFRLAQSTTFDRALNAGRDRV